MGVANVDFFAFNAKNNSYAAKWVCDQVRWAKGQEMMKTVFVYIKELFVFKGLPFVFFPLVNFSTDALNDLKENFKTKNTLYMNGAEISCL